VAITTSAKKADRASKRKQVFNVRRKRTMKETVKEVQDLAMAGKTKEAEGKLSDAYKAIDKATKRGVIKANTAARKKSSLAKAVAKGGEKKETKKPAKKAVKKVVKKEEK
jgi:small subunit ribosomal protein S20